MHYEEIFRAFDRDQDGYLSGKELGKCMKKALGEKFSSKDLKYIIMCADKDENGQMDCEEFRLTATVLKTVKMDELKELKGVFSGFDLDGNGTINKAEFKECMEKLGQGLSADECNEMIKSADRDGDEVISFLEFVLMVKEAEQKTEMLDDEQSMREAFKMFDENGDGHIDKNELKQVLATMHQDSAPSDIEVDEMFKLADQNGDGKITYTEFRALLNDS